MKKYRFALMSFVFVALAAYALTPATQWGDVSPTNTLSSVAYYAGLMSTNTPSGVFIGGGLRVVNHPTIVHSLSDDAAWADRLGYGSISFGSGSFASGQFSYALGLYCQALGDRSFAHGYESKAYGFTDYAGGTGCIASNGNTIAIGMYSCSTDYSYVWQGYPVSYPQLYYSHGRGSYNINPVGGLSGFWIGETNMEDHIIAFAPKLAYNLYPVDLGGGTREVPSDTQTYMAIGYDVSVTGMASTVVGNAARARGENSSAFGYGAEALADNSLVAGAHSTAGGTQSLAIGVDAAAWAYGFAIGNATEAEVDGTAVGFQSYATDGGTAIGSHAQAAGENSVAIGYWANAVGESSIQIGYNSSDEYNASNHSFCVFGKMLLDADGHVPLLTGKSYDLSTNAGITNALADIITALGGAVQ